MLETLDAIDPCLFFHPQATLKQKGKDFPHKRHKLADFQAFHEEEIFAQVYAAFHEKGLYFVFKVESPFVDCSFTEFTRKDAIELLIDTRDVKKRRQLSSYCHHFVVLPEKDGGLFAKEITRFHAEEAHPICDPKELVVSSMIEKNHYEVSLHIPSFCLHGFDPLEFDRLGFYYRIYRAKQPYQSFFFSSSKIAIERNPQFWPSLQMQTKR